MTSFARFTVRAGLGALLSAALALPALAQDTPAPVETQRLTPAAGRADSFFGSVSAAEMSSLSYQARGCIVEISDDAKRERVVEAGEVLVRLDDQRVRLALLTSEARLLELSAALDERRLALDAARADERRRQAELNLSTQEFERSSAMLSRGLINESAMDAVEKSYLNAVFTAERAAEAIASAEAAVRRAEIALEIGTLDSRSAQIDLEKLVLAAPFDGILVGFEANVGDCVQEGELAARVYVPDQKSVDVYLQISRLTRPETSGLAIGSAVQVYRVNRQTCGGTITRIDTEADLENQLVQVTVDVDEPCAEQLFLNESVEIEVMQDDAAAAYILPAAALVGEAAVFLVDEAAQTLSATPVEVVHQTARDVTVLIAGARGRLVVTNPTAEMADGMPVTLGPAG